MIEHLATAPRRIGLWLGLAGILLTAGAGVLTRRRDARTGAAPRAFFTGRRGAVLVASGIVLLLLPIVFPLPYEQPHVVLLTALVAGAELECALLVVKQTAAALFRE